MCNSPAHNGRKNRESLRKRLGRRVSAAIARRDSGRCAYCGATAESSCAALHLDHLTPRSAGGTDDPANLITACRACNSARHDLPLAAWCARIGISWRTIRGQASRAIQVSA